jgi:hypothetical protein
MAGDAQRAIVVRTSAVKAAPSFGANTVTVLPVGSAVELGPRVGGWQKIIILPEANQAGWLRTYQVRSDINAVPAAVKQRSAKRGVLSGLSSLSRSTSALFGRREMEGDSGNMTATMGVRGLSEADLENASPDTQELQQFKQYSVSNRTAQSFAKTGGLQVRKVKELPKPRKKKSKKRDQS